MACLQSLEGLSVARGDHYTGPINSVQSKAVKGIGQRSKTVKSVGVEPIEIGSRRLKEEHARVVKRTSYSEVLEFITGVLARHRDLS